MLNIAEYTDHRKFLADFYDETKKRNPNFSYQLFSDKAGIKSKGFLYNVIQGSRNLSKSHIFGLIQVMKLNKKEAAYFENLVAFNLSGSLNEQSFFYDRLSQFRSSEKTASQAKVVHQNQYEFYSTWYHSVIRSIIDIYGFDGDYEWLARSVSPQIKPLQAKKSVELLLKLGFVRKDSETCFTVTDRCISTPKEILDLAITNFHIGTGKLALQALAVLPVDKRNFSGMTLGISRETYNEICEEIYNLRMKILNKAQADKNADMVYQLNFQFFPVTKASIERKNV
jgi:uncharacterized protein (TIGR02147 family)